MDHLLCGLSKIPTLYSTGRSAVHVDYSILAYFNQITDCCRQISTTVLCIVVPYCTLCIVVGFFLNSDEMTGICYNRYELFMDKSLGVGPVHYLAARIERHWPEEDASRKTTMSGSPIQTADIITRRSSRLTSALVKQPAQLRRK